VKVNCFNSKSYLTYSYHSNVQSVPEFRVEFMRTEVRRMAQHNLGSHYTRQIGLFWVKIWTILM